MVSRHLLCETATKGIASPCGAYLGFGRIGELLKLSALIRPGMLVQTSNIELRG